MKNKEKNNRKTIRKQEKIFRESNKKRNKTEKYINGFRVYSNNIDI